MSQIQTADPLAPAPLSDDEWLAAHRGRKKFESLSNDWLEKTTQPETFAQNKTSDSGGDAEALAHAQAHAQNYGQELAKQFPAMDSQTRGQITNNFTQQAYARTRAQYVQNEVDKIDKEYQAHKDDVTPFPALAAGGRVGTAVMRHWAGNLPWAQYGVTAADYLSGATGAKQRFKDSQATYRDYHHLGMEAFLKQKEEEESGTVSQTVAPSIPALKFVGELMTPGVGAGGLAGQAGAAAKAGLAAKLGWQAPNLAQKATLGLAGRMATGAAFTGITAPLRQAQEIPQAMAPPVSTEGGALQVGEGKTLGEAASRTIPSQILSDQAFAIASLPMGRIATNRVLNAAAQFAAGSGEGIAATATDQELQKQLGLMPEGSAFRRIFDKDPEKKAAAWRELASTAALFGSLKAAHGIAPDEAMQQAADHLRSQGVKVTPDELHAAAQAALVGPTTTPETPAAAPSAEARGPEAAPSPSAEDRGQLPHEIAGQNPEEWTYHTPQIGRGQAPEPGPTQPDTGQGGQGGAVGRAAPGEGVGVPGPADRAGAAELPGAEPSAVEPTPADALPSRRTLNSNHLHPAQPQARKLSEGWKRNLPSQEYPDNGHHEAFLEPREGLTPQNLKNIARTKPVSLPTGTPEEARPLLQNAWDTVSRLWPQMAWKVKKIEMVDRGNTRARAAISPDGTLLVPTGQEVSPGTLWHEFVHLEQIDEGRWKPKAERSDQEHLEMEREAYARQGQVQRKGGLLDRFEVAQQGKPTPIGAKKPQAAPEPQPLSDEEEKQLRRHKNGEVLPGKELDNLRAKGAPVDQPFDVNPAMPGGEQDVRRGRSYDAAQEAALVQGPGANVSQLPPPSPTLGARLKAGAKAAYTGLGSVGKWSNRQLDAIRAIFQKTLPRMMRANEDVGNLGAQIAASPEYARRRAKQLVRLVLGPKVSDEYDRHVGAIFQEYRQRQIENAYRNAGDPDTADAVKTIVGELGSPLQTEADYLNGLHEMRTNGIFDRYKQHVVPEMEEHFKKAMGMDSTDDIDAKTQDPEMPWTSKTLKEGETVPGAVHTTGQGNPRNARVRKLGASKQAFGTAEGYDISFHRNIESMLARRVELGNKKVWAKTGIEKGLFARGKPGEQHTLNGEESAELKDFFPQKPIISGEGEDAKAMNVPAQTSLYIPKSLEQETAKMLNSKDLGLLQQGAEALGTIGQPITKTALFGTGVEALNHAKTLLQMLNRPGLDPRNLASHIKGLAYSDPALEERLVQLAKRGMTKPSGMESAWKYDPTQLGGKGLDFMQDAIRLTMEDAYDKMVDKGLIRESEAEKRDFLNQAGNYNPRTMSVLVRALRTTGIGPFAVGSTTGMTSSLRALVGQHGLTTTSWGAEAKLRGEMMARVLTPPAMATLISFLAWKKHDDVPWGALKVGEREDGSSKYIDVSDFSGFGRAFQAIGGRAVERGVRKDQAVGKTEDTALGDLASATIRPGEGPMVQFGHTLATGKSIMGRTIANEPSVATTAKGIAKAQAMGKPSPETSKYWSHLGAAAANANPTVAALSGLDEPPSVSPPWEERLGKLGGPWRLKYGRPPKIGTTRGR